MTRLTPLLALAILLVSAASPTLAQVPATLSAAPPAVAQSPSVEIPVPTISPMPEIPPPNPPEPQQLLQAASNLVFEENRGQWNTTALFRVHANGYDAFITGTGMAMVQVQAPAIRPESQWSGFTEELPEPTKAWATHMTLIGSNPAPLVTTSQPTEYHTNYFIGNDPTQWHTDIPTYTRVTLHDVYPGIDLDYHASNEGDLKYDFIVHPSADPGQIRQRYVGQTKLTINPDGTLAIHTGLGTIQQGEPLTKQANGVPVSNRYALDDATLTYVLGNHDSTQDLIIDPLVYSTYIGRSGIDVGEGVAVDSGGNAYITGYTTSGNYPTTSGAYDITANGDYDVFVTKLNSAGSGLAYSTFLGGSGFDVGHGVAVDSGGNAYITGYADSANYPTTSGAYDTTDNDGMDVFATKLNSTGSALTYSTYLGGISYGYGVAVDSGGNAYVTGRTLSPNYPTTGGAYGTTYNGATDVFVTKVNLAGSGLVYSTYLGGSMSLEIGYGVAVDSGGNAYITGRTSSTNYPTTSGAYDTTYNGAFVTKLNSAGSALTYSTFLGGSGFEVGTGVAVDSGGNAYITGYTKSTDYPTTSGAYGTTYNGGVYDAFATKLNSAGSGLVYSTFLGGTSYDYGFGVAVDLGGNAYITGYAGSANYPTTSGAYDTTHNGGYDVFVTKLNWAGSGLAYSTLLGGSSNDYGHGVAVDSGGNAYITGYAGSANYPTTSGAYDTTHNGGDDVLVAGFDLNVNPPSEPINLQTLSGPDRGQIALQWEAPFDDDGEVLTYEVYSGTNETNLAHHAVVHESLSFIDSGLPDDSIQYYAVRAIHSGGYGPWSEIVLGRTLEFVVGHMQIAQKPECLSVPPEDPGFCNLEQLGFTTAIGHADAEKPAFTINWGDFNGHEHIQLENGTPRFWMDFDLNVFTAAQGFPDYYGEQVPVAQLERWTGSAWAPLEDGVLGGTLVAPTGSDVWRLNLTGPLDQLTSDALDTQAGSATFRLNPFDQPGLPGQKWVLELTAAQSELVAPPVIYVHGWNPFPYESPSTYAGEDAGWETSMTNRLTEQSTREFGQNPWDWSLNTALLDIEFDGKADFRLASEELYRRILDVQRPDPENPLGAGVSYDGPVNLIAHSLGGLVSRYMLENTLPILRALNGGHFDDDPDQQSLIDAWNQDNGSVPATTDLVGSVVMMGTPNLGSGWAEKYIGGVDKRKGALCQSSDECRYYVTQDGQNLLTHYGFAAGLLKGGHEWDTKDWDKESIGAHRNPDYYGSDVSVLADFELLLLEDRDNPVLENLQNTFSPSGVHYFLMAGVETRVPFEGDVIVSTKSATNDFDDRACWNRYQKLEANYGEIGMQGYGFTYVSHGDLPFDRKLQDDALMFLSGDHESPCDNQPSYSSSAQQASSMMAHTSQENDDCAPLLIEPYASRFGPAFRALPGDDGNPCGGDASEAGPEAFGASGFGMMSLESESQPSGYEAPIASNYSVDGATYATRLEWDAPGLTNGTLILYGLNGTMANATFTVRSPSGETASMEAGNTSIVLWGDLQNLGPDDRISIDFSDAEQGSWTAWINRTMPWPGALIPAAWFNTSFAMELQTDLHGVVGQAVTYRVLLPIPGADVVLELAEPSGTIEALTLVDDGVGADATGGDGIYSGSHIFLEDGTSPYGVQATVDGLILKATASLRVYDEEPAPMAFPPWTPLNVSATSGPGRGAITLTWQPHVDGPALTGYDVYRGNETAQELVASIGDETAYTDSGLQNDAIYHYRVASRNEAGWSRLSDAVISTTFNVPSEPANLEAEAGIGQVTLTWQAAASNGVLSVTGYNVYRGNASGAEAPYDAVGVVLNYTDTDATPGTRYYYRVSAHNSAVEGDLSNEASARPSSLLLSIPAIPLPLDEDAIVVVRVCDSDSASGCQGGLAVESPSLPELGDAFDPANPQDPDGDQHLTESEAAAGSNPFQANSTPITDDDGDGVPNGNEAGFSAVSVDPPSECTGSLGVVATPQCGGYTQPPGYPTDASGAARLVYVDPSNRIWAWDSVCLSGAEGDYEVCKATTNHVLNLTPYTGDFLSDGYGWRRIQAPSNAADLDGDGYLNDVELQSSSNPAQSRSTPESDDDGDGVINRLEFKTQGRTGIYCSGAAGVVYNAGCGNGYANPPGWSFSSSTGGASIHSEGGRTWVWDSVCVPGARGDYAACQATTSYTLDESLYTGEWLSDGYGWRLVSDPDSYLCIELQVATTPALTLACIDHALVPPDIDTALHGLDPLELRVPAATPEIQVTYLHESALLNPVLVACAPLHPTLDDATWLLANGGESSLTVTLKDGLVAGESVTVPWLGQVLAAGQATLGGIPCG